MAVSIPLRPVWGVFWVLDWSGVVEFWEGEGDGLGDGEGDGEGVVVGVGIGAFGSGIA
jgi:hypothetical protein